MEKIEFVMQNKLKSKPLKVLASEIFAGASLYSVNKLQKDPGGIPVLNIKNIYDGSIFLENAERVCLKGFKSAMRYIVFPGDVLVVSRGTKLKVAVVPKNTEKLLITSNLIAIRLEGKILPNFLVAYLQTPKGYRDTSSPIRFTGKNIRACCCSTSAIPLQYRSG